MSSSGSCERDGEVESEVGIDKFGAPMDVTEIDAPLRSALRLTSCESMKRHINIAIESRSGDRSANQPLPRDLEDIRRLGSSAYQSTNPWSYLIRNGHEGQRKLCIAMIEFITEVQAHRQHEHRPLDVSGIPPLLVVYVGSSIMAAAAGRDAFPGTKFVCFDPSWKMTVPVLHRESGAYGTRIMEERVRVLKNSSGYALSAALKWRDVAFVTDSAGKFTDETCECVKDLLRRMPGYELAFVSDVRSPVRQTPAEKESAIARDMADQARWVAKLGARFYSLKLRLPFEATSEIRAIYETACDSFPAGPEGRRPLDVPGLSETRVPYLSGRCVLQKFARNMSTEMRLMGMEAPSVVVYDIRDIERTFFPFNTVHRCNTRFDLVEGRRFKSSDTRAESALIARANEHIAATVASRDRMATFDEIGEAAVIADAACVAAASKQPFADAARCFDNIAFAMKSLFERRRGQVRA